ncbi:MAG: hypothetical protein ACFNON_05975 [Veillonella parvula]
MTTSNHRPYTYPSGRIKVLSLDWLFGFRNIEAKKPIRTPEDMKGLKLRVPTSQLYSKLYCFRIFCLILPIHICNKSF